MNIPPPDRGAYPCSGSWEAALRAAGGVCQAVDGVVKGKQGGRKETESPFCWRSRLFSSGLHRNAFCATRPPGHHAGPSGLVTCENDKEGSHGFCLLNNVAIGAAYARYMYHREVCFNV